MFKLIILKVIIGNWNWNSKLQRKIHIEWILPHRWSFRPGASVITHYLVRIFIEHQILKDFFSPENKTSKLTFVIYSMCLTLSKSK